jgi:hypothetical protein
MFWRGADGTAAIRPRALAEEVDPLDPAGVHRLQD